MQSVTSTKARLVPAQESDGIVEGGTWNGNDLEARVQPIGQDFVDVAPLILGEVAESDLHGQRGRGLDDGPVAYAQSAGRVLGEPGVHRLGRGFGREGRDEQTGVQVVPQ